MLTKKETFFISISTVNTSKCLTEVDPRFLLSMDGIPRLSIRVCGIFRLENPKISRYKCPLSLAGAMSKLITAF